MIDPCGMVVDYWPACSTRPFWFNSRLWDGQPLTPEEIAQGYVIDGDKVKRRVMIKWYFAPEGAKDLPIDTIYASSEWLNWQEQCRVDLGEIPRYKSGERGGEFVDGTPGVRGGRVPIPLGATGQSYCGRPEWFMGNVPDGDMPRGPGGLPICCNPGLGAAIGLQGPGLPIIEPTRASLGLRGFNVTAALAFYGVIPANLDPRYDLGLGPTYDAPAQTQLGLSTSTPPASAPLAIAYPRWPGSLGLGPLPAGGALFLVRGADSTDWSIGVGSSLSPSPLICALVNGATQNSVNGVTVLSQCRYYHVGAVWDGADFRIYLDANLEGAVAAAGALRTTAAGILWQGNYEGVFAPGSWALLRIYGTALTSAQIIADAQGTAGPGLIAEYPLTDGSGATAVDVVGGADAALFDGPTWTLDGPGGGGLTFDGISQYGLSPNVVPDAGPFTITLWYRPPRT